MARKFLDPASEQDPSKDPNQEPNTTDFIRVKKRRDRSGAEVLNNEKYDYLGWQTGPQRYVTERTIYKEGSVLEESYEFDKEYNLVRLRQEGDQGETPQELRWTYDPLGQPTSKKEIVGVYQQEEQYVFDSRRNLLYSSNDVGQEQYIAYSHDHSFPLETRQRVQSSGDVQWERVVTERDYTGAGARPLSTTFMEAGEPSPQGTGFRILAGHSKEIRRVGEIAFWTTEGICQEISITVSMKAEAPSQTVGYELAYQMRNDSNWTVVDSKAIQAGLYMDAHVSHNYNISLPYEDFARIRVKVTQSGLGTSHVLANNVRCSKYTVLDWDPINSITTEYDYYDNKPGALLRESRAWLNATGTEQHKTEYDYEDVFNAYVSKITNTVTRPDNSTGEYRREGEYDFFGRLTVLREVEDFGTEVSWEQEFEYDRLGRLEVLRSPEVRFDGQISGPHVTTWEYDDDEPAITVTVRSAEYGPIIDKRKYKYDPFGRLLTIQEYLDGAAGSPVPVVSKFYDAAGLLAEEILHRDGSDDVVTKYEYDAFDRPLRIIYGESRDESDRNYVEYSYSTSPTRKITTLVDTLERETTQQYDKSGRLVLVQVPTDDGTSTYDTAYTYDLLNRMLSVEDPAGQVTAYEYGLGGRLEKVIPPGANTHPWVFEYDALGNQVSADYGYATNDKVKYTYDERNRVVQIEYPEVKIGQTIVAPGRIEEISYKFVDTGAFLGEQRTVISKENGVKVGQLETLYDSNGRLRSETWEIPNLNGSGFETYTMKYDFDAAGNMAKVEYPIYPAPGSHAVSYNYNETGRLTSVPGYVSNFTYDHSGFLESLTYSNGAVTNIVPDVRNRPASIETMLGNDILLDLDYGYDFQNNIVAINGETQEYNTRDMLITGRTPLENAVHEVGYTYDAAGNRSSEEVDGQTREYKYNGDNRIEEITVNNVAIETFTYTNAGVIESRTKDGATTQYFYDGAGRLIRVDQDNNTIAEYAYDGDGRLIKTIEHLPGGTRTTIRLPMGTETAYEFIREGTDQIEHIYIRANGMYIARETRANGGPPQVSYYHGDHLGSIRAVSGIHDAKLTYDPFGQLIESKDAHAEHLHRFTGKPQDSTGLYYYGARFYDPTIGRFISQDPAMDGLNWYVYAAGNPLKYVDPDGLALEWAHFGGRVHNQYGLQVSNRDAMKRYVVDKSFTRATGGMIRSRLRPDFFDTYTMTWLDLKPDTPTGRADAQRTRQKYSPFAEEGNAAAFMLDVFKTTTYRLPTPVVDNFGRSWDVTIRAGDGGFMYYSKTYRDNRVAQDVLTGAVVVGGSVAAAALIKTGVGAPAGAYILNMLLSP